MEESTYQEEYDAEVQYIDNDDGTPRRQRCGQEAQAGYHEVTAMITKKNGVEESRDIIAETVLQEPVPKDCGARNPDAADLY